MAQYLTMMYICLRVSIVTKHHDHSNWEGKGLHFHLHHPRKSGQAFKQGRNLEVGANSEVMERCCLLAFSPWFVCSVCILIEPRTASPEMALPTMALLHQSVIKKVTYKFAYSIIL